MTLRDHWRALPLAPTASHASCVCSHSGVGAAAEAGDPSAPMDLLCVCCGQVTLLVYGASTFEYPAMMC